MQLAAQTRMLLTICYLCFLSSSVHNVLGPRLYLFLGTCGYPLHRLTRLNSTTNIHPDASHFAVTAGTISGVCAALLWTAQGSLMMAYPTEAQKGTFIGYFWVIFNLGGVVGSVEAFGLNFYSTVKSQTRMLLTICYLCFLCIFFWPGA
ncbi:uncharacterized protein EDB91DRAFT_650783 [Suillus paluster]|uniref:uncharacterized protein n=1 Tax=Suillus paluster TaxID=48578 RepID=UPI001B87CF61|nr:uncharacterized protein EDB91DRAFT_650783 [Suillus paluster]KAG1733025.1 hypothetical protein EDB91DRAFT_650783 [Suillus paluster]